MEEDSPSVIIPNHLQVHSSDCSHLSFGSFGTGIDSTFSGPFASRPLKNNLEERSETADAPSIGHSDARYSLHMISFCYIIFFFYLVIMLSLTCLVAEILSIMGMSILEVPQMQI